MKNHEKIWLNKDDLQNIRESFQDAKQLLTALNVRIHKETPNEIWCFSPFRDEKIPSFHIQKKNLSWFDFGEQTGAGPLELIQKIKNLNIYEAGKWAVENFHLRISETIHKSTSERSGGSFYRKNKEVKKEKKEQKKNLPLQEKFSLLPYLELEHDFITQRGISTKTAQTLGFGFLPSSSTSSLRNRVMFQIRGIEEKDEQIKEVLLGHIGRAITQHQADTEGKWRFYSGFNKSLELYNINKILLNPKVRFQAQKNGLILVEGCFDVAKLYEAGFFNTVATFSSYISEKQAEKIKFIASKINIPKLFIWYDNDSAGREGTERTFEKIKALNLPIKIESFDWGKLKNYPQINDVCDCSVKQLKDLLEQ